MSDDKREQIRSHVQAILDEKVTAGSRNWTTQNHLKEVLRLVMRQPNLTEVDHGYGAAEISNLFNDLKNHNQSARSRELGRKKTFGGEIFHVSDAALKIVWPWGELLLDGRYPPRRAQLTPAPAQTSLLDDLAPPVPAEEGALFPTHPDYVKVEKAALALLPQAPVVRSVAAKRMWAALRTTAKAAKGKPTQLGAPYRNATLHWFGHTGGDTGIGLLTDSVPSWVLTSKGARLLTATQAEAKLKELKASKDTALSQQQKKARLDAALALGGEPRPNQPPPTVPPPAEPPTLAELRRLPVAQISAWLKARKLDLPRRRRSKASMIKLLLATYGIDAARKECPLTERATVRLPKGTLAALKSRGGVSQAIRAELARAGTLPASCGGAP
jgi:hypothetical protein